MPLIGGTDSTDLGDWPVFPLQDITQISLDELRKLITRGDAPAGTYATRISPGGTAKERMIAQSPPKSAACQEFLRLYFDDYPCEWEPQSLFLVNAPCYIGVRSGVVLRADGSIIDETLYPSIGEKTVEHLVGPGLTAENLAAQIRIAPQIDDGLWAPLFSRWSNVYGHALTESLSQDSAFDRLGLLSSITYAGPADLLGAQQIILAQAQGRVAKFANAFVRVPRAIFTTALYNYGHFGTEFQHFVARTRARILASHAHRQPPSEKIYISRLGVPARRMTNEAELIECLSSRGFRVIAGQHLCFEDQVAAFRAARIVVGPYGSNLANSAFAPAGATLCELHPLNCSRLSPLLDSFYTRLAAAMRFSYGICIGENPSGTDPWACDISEVIELIETAEATPPTSPQPIEQEALLDAAATTLPQDAITRHSP